MTSVKVLEIEYKGRKFSYDVPLGIYLDGEITGRIHDSVIPKYNELVPEKLANLDKDGIRRINLDAKRQLAGIAQKDTEEVRQALRNTIDLTANLLL